MKKKARGKRTPAARKKAARKPAAKKQTPSTRRATRPARAGSATAEARPSTYTPAPLTSDGWPPFRYPPP